MAEKAFNPARFITAWFAYSQIDNKVSAATWHATMPVREIPNGTSTGLQNALENLKVD